MSIKKFTLRQATEEDLAFLYNVSTEAMRPVVEALGHKEKGLSEYKEKFEPEKIQIIQSSGKDIGRLRVVRSSESIYIGGIQILPEFQGQGIGTAILEELIKESNEQNIPIILEVHNVNTKARAFYERLGFTKTEVMGEKLILKYFPKL